MLDPQVALDFEARDRILSAHQRKELVQWLEYQCAGESTYRPVSANDARAILRFWGLDSLDARLLGGVFPSARWEQVGETHSDSGRCHARKIRTFTLRDGVRLFPVQRPAWVGCP